MNIAVKPLLYRLPVKQISRILKTFGNIQHLREQHFCSYDFPLAVLQL